MNSVPIICSKKQKKSI